MPSRSLLFTFYRKKMLRTIKGIYRDGTFELLEPAPIQGTVRVLITFLKEQPEVGRKNRLPLLSLGNVLVIFYYVERICTEMTKLPRATTYDD